MENIWITYMFKTARGIRGQVQTLKKKYYKLVRGWDLNKVGHKHEHASFSCFIKLKKYTSVAFYSPDVKMSKLETAGFTT